MNQEKSVYITFIMENRGIYLEQKLFQDKYMISIQSYKKKNKQKKSPTVCTNHLPSLRYFQLYILSLHKLKAVIMNGDPFNQILVKST